MPNIGQNRKIFRSTHLNSEEEKQLISIKPIYESSIPPWLVGYPNEFVQEVPTKLAIKILKSDEYHEIKVGYKHFGHKYKVCVKTNDQNRMLQEGICSIRFTSDVQQSPMLLFQDDQKAIYVRRLFAPQPHRNM